MRVVLRLTTAPMRARREQWQALLDSSNQRFRDIEATLDEHRGKRVAIYGAGLVLQGYQAYTTKMPELQGVYDADPKKVGREVFGVPVSSPEAIRADDIDMIIITVVGYEAEVRQFLR